MHIDVSRFKSLVSWDFKLVIKLIVGILDIVTRPGVKIFNQNHPFNSWQGHGTIIENCLLKNQTTKRRWKDRERDEYNRYNTFT